MTMPEAVPEQAPSHGMPYIQVAAIEASIGELSASGGQVVNGPFPLPGIGQLAVVHDPVGGNVSLMQSEST